MTILAIGSSVTTTPRDGGTIAIATNGGFGSVTVTPTGGSASTLNFGPEPVRRVFGPYAEGASVVISNQSCNSLDYDAGSGGYDPANVAITGGTAKFNDGAAAAPSVAFTSDSGTGFKYRAGGAIDFVSGGAVAATIVGGNAFALSGSVRLGFSSGDATAVASDTYLARDAANTLAQRNGTAAQTFNLYGSYTDGSNWERIALIGGVGTQTIQAQSAGTGSANIGFAYSTKGTGSHAFNTGGGTQFAIVNTANSANYLTVNGGSAGAGPSLVAVGSDTNVAIAIAQKGTAIMQLSGQTTGTTVGAAGTAAAIPTPAAYLTLNVNGTNYRIPLCN